MELTRRGFLKSVGAATLAVAAVSLLGGCEGGEMVGNRTRIRVVKNKIAPPFKEAEFDIMFGEGISREGDILDLAANTGVINKSGAWYAYEGDKIGQGRENAKQFLKQNPEICREVEEKVREGFGLDGAETAEEKEEKAKKEKTDAAGKKNAAE